MVALAETHRVRLRPHFKTHQSAEIGSWFKSDSIDTITVSSVSMARYFAQYGWTDITIAFPFNPLEWQEMKQIADRCRLQITLSSPDAVNPLLKRVDIPLGAFIELDTGSHRTGFDPTDKTSLLSIIKRVEAHPYLHFAGLLFHNGQSYRCRGPQSISELHGEVMTTIRPLIREIKSVYPQAVVSAGDTPCCSVAKDWEDVDEIRPGNFLFYDLMQWQIGSCNLEDIALALACPVVSKHENRRTIVVYGGAVHLSKEKLTWKDREIFGLPVTVNEKGWEDPEMESYVSSISQEHGLIHASKSFYDAVRIGDCVGILPVHACLTSDVMKSYRLTKTGHNIDMMQQ